MNKEKEAMERLIKTNRKLAKALFKMSFVDTQRLRFDFQFIKQNENRTRVLIKESVSARREAKESLHEQH
jgi:hypothetical protein